MRSNQGNKEIREKILKAACRVFSEKGFRETSHSEICQRAGVSSAVSNQFFHSKEELYLMVWRHIHKTLIGLYPPSLPTTTAPNDRLFEFISSTLKRLAFQDSMKYIHRLLMMERFQPTGLVDDLLDNIVFAHHDCLMDILRELLEPETGRREVDWCKHSILGQCITLHSSIAPQQSGSIMDREDLDQMARHITRFSLAGIAAIKHSILDPSQQSGICQSV